MTDEDEEDQEDGFVAQEPSEPLAKWRVRSVLVEFYERDLSEFWATITHHAFGADDGHIWVLPLRATSKHGALMEVTKLVEDNSPFRPAPGRGGRWHKPDRRIQSWDNSEPILERLFVRR